MTPHPVDLTHKPWLMGNRCVNTSVQVQEKASVLLVDDSRVVRRMFSNVLSGKYDCVEAGSFEEAISVLKAREFAVVVTDIIMPGMSGIELLRKIIEDFPHTEVIVASGIDRPQRALDAIRLGAFDYLIKPCEPAVLAVTIDRAMARRKLILDSGLYKVELERQNAELILRKTQLERLQAQLVQNEKMASLGQLAAGVAHELNNPVGFVHANIEMLSQVVGDLVRLVKVYEAHDNGAVAAQIMKEIGYPAILNDVTSMLTDCRDGSDRIRDIVQNLRTFSRLDEADYEQTDVHEGIDATVRLLGRYFKASNITLRREYENLPPIAAFAGPLNQVWMNLLANAAQAIGSEEGEITIATQNHGENISVEVIDTGCGIATQHINRIFDPFFTTKPVGEGTGLGLSISFGIVQRHGGSISVNSNLNQGTSFKILLPKQFEPSVLPEQKSIVCYDAV